MSRRADVTHPWWGFAVLALPTLLLSVDSTVLYLALPSVSRALHASPVEQLWVLDIYSFVLAGFLVPMGSLGDRIRTMTRAHLRSPAGRSLTLHSVTLAETGLRATAALLTTGMS